jgi:hypothetical protein
MLAWLRNLLVTRVAPRLELPAAEIIVHLIVTLASVGSIAIVELALSGVGLSGKAIPKTGLTLGELMFFLEVAAATLIIAIGVIKAAIALIRS